MPKKKFLKYPEYPGGKTEFKQYVIDNLQYPEEALENHIEGTVHLSAEVDDNGQVIGVTVDNGIGYGCDEEAVRLVSGMHFGGVTNRGVRLKTRKRFRIRFSLKDSGKADPQEINEPASLTVEYSFRNSESVSGHQANKPTEKVTGSSYTYTVTVGSPNPFKS